MTTGAISGLIIPIILLVLAIAVILLIVFRKNKKETACPYCGAKIIPGDEFCMECGKKIHN